MFQADQKKKLIIVCDEKTKVFAIQLSQLISANDDKEKVIGCKDGSVEASVWEEKNYIASETSISSEQNILFIGETKSAKNVIPNIKVTFNKFGIHCGWLGNMAVIYVDDVLLKKDEYDAFIAYCKQQEKEVQERVKLNPINTAHKALKGISLLLPYVYPIAIYGIVSGVKAKKKIMKQQYNFGVYYFYMNDLAKFLEE